MRTATAAQQLAWSSPGSVTHVQVRIADSGGTIRDWTDLFGQNWIESVSWGETQDQPGQDATITLIWRSYFDNASPWVAAGQRLEGYLGVGQRALIDVAIMPEGIWPGGSDWITVFDGQIDSFALAYPTGTIQCRDRIVAQLTDRWVETDTKYGAAAGRPVELVIGDLLTAWGGSPTQALWTPETPGFAITEYNQQAEPILTAAQALALLIGWDLRPRWRASLGAYQLALTEPDRVGGAPVYTIPLNKILEMSRVGVAIEDIRNVVRVYYADGSLTAGGQLSIKNVLITNATSITKYGRRFFELTEGSSSGIDTSAEATRLANAILSDLSDPDITATVTVPLLWWLELGDEITLPADGERFGAPQILAIVGLRHSVLDGAATTTYQLYGKPRTGRRNWMEREARAGVSPAVPQIKPRAQLPPHSQVKIGGVLVVAGWPATSGFAALEFHKGAAADFVPTALTLVQLGKERSLYLGDTPDALAYYKTVVVDGHGNRSDPSEAASGIAGYVPAPALAPAARAVVQVRRITTAQTISASGAQTVQLQQEDFDPASVWTAASYWLIPLVEGIYRFDVDLLVSFDAATTYEVTIGNDDLGAVWSSGTRAAVTERYRDTVLIELIAGEKYLLRLSRDAGSADVEIGSKLIIEPTLAIGQDTVPLLTTAPAITGTLSVGGVLTCSTGTWSAVPTATYAFAWLRDGVKIVGATSATYTLLVADQGALLACIVVATNRAGAATAVAAPVGAIEPAAEAPINTLAPAITGTVTEGEELSCSPGTWTGYPEPTLTYQWRRDAAPIVGATSATYTLTSGEVGLAVTCAVVGTNASGSPTAISNVVGPVAAAAAAPTSTLAPAVSGTTVVGATLTCTTGTWSGSPAPTYAYQWRRTAGLGFAAIVGETAATYDLAAADIDTLVSCVVTATNASGDAGQASNAVGPITSGAGNRLLTEAGDILTTEAGNRLLLE